MKQSRLLIMSIVFAAVLSFALTPFGLREATAQPPPPGVAGTYAEVSTEAEEVYTVIILHADGTCTLIETAGPTAASTTTTQNVLAGAWQQAADALTVDLTVIGPEPPQETPAPPQTPSVQVNVRDYSVIFQDNTYEIASVTSTRGPVDAFTAQRVTVGMPLPLPITAPPPTTP